MLLDFASSLFQGALIGRRSWQAPQRATPGSGHGHKTAGPLAAEEWPDIGVL